MRKIVVAFDHAGVELHGIVVKTIRDCGCDVIDVGTDTNASVDFPDYAYIGAQKILEKEAEKGIFVCGSGVGMCLAANKIKGIYASVCHDTYTAHQAVEHDGINVLCLGSRVIGPEAARELIIAFLSAAFNNKPNQIRRVKKVQAIEDGCFELKNNSMRLYEFGQSVWLDNIRRGLLRSDKIGKDIQRGIIRGISSNPTIFRQAIANSRDYENALTSMAQANIDEESIFSQLVVEDMRNAADLLRELYIKSNGNDGFVSLEISPLLAHDCERTISEAKSLWKAVNRPNLMIKIPVTDESLSAITDLIAAGVNLNLTLIFSPRRYTEAANAYIEGLHKRLSNGQSIDKIRCVASVFVSRIDTKIDAILSEKGISARNLMGKAAIRNAQNIYNLSEEIFSSDNFAEIDAHGGKPQRVLWASTGTKNPLYKPTYYAEALIGKNTVTTLPSETLESLLKTGSLKPALPVESEEISQFFDELHKTGIDIEPIFAALEEEGIEAFKKDYLATLDSIRSRCESIKGNTQSLQEQIQKTYEKFEQESVMRRMFAKDPTVWTFNTQSFAEIRNRLGWLDIYKTTVSAIPEYKELRNDILKEGISKILLIGMGGSSLAAEVMSEIFDDKADVKLKIIDSTDPAQVKAARKEHGPNDTLYIVSSKSGGTAEVRALMNYFYDQACIALGEKAASHFIAITDPGTNLEKTAKELGFRKIFFSDPSVGGRYSALAPFGIIPAVLMGLDMDIVGRKILEMMRACSASLPTFRNEGAALGCFIGTSALNGRDKLTILTDSEFKGFGSWVEQIIAESSGKEGKGIIPICLEPEPEGDVYANDRCFVYLNKDNSKRIFLEKIRQQGHPIFEISIDDKYDLFGEFYRWEIAAAAACAVIGVNPFDQPDVQDSKIRTVTKINEFRENGKLNDLSVSWSDEDADVYVEDDTIIPDQSESYNDILNAFISGAESGQNYIAINAYLPIDPETNRWLQKLRFMILKSTNCATMLSYGPRFQHSTGQLHKGGPNNGLFIQIVSDITEDLDIPNENLTFGILERAQSLGDYESLLAHDRKVIRICFKNGIPEQE